MPHIREVRWIVYYDVDGHESKPILQQRNGLYAYWDDVPTIKEKQKEEVKK